MSIILKALKKIQEQEEKRAGKISSAKAAKEKRVQARPPVSPAPSPPPGDSAAHLEAVPDGPGRPQSALRHPVLSAAGTARPESPHRFGLGPKALLGLLVLLGVFTTGWFFNKIFINMNPAADTETSAPSTDAEQPVNVIRAVQVRPPIGEAEASVPAQTAPATTEPTAGKEGAPASEAAPAPAAQPSPPRPAAQPVEPEPAPAPVKEAKPQKKERPKFKINAIAWRSDEPKAIVNMQRVFEGDVIEGATVLAIKRKIIEFEYEGETFVVRF